MTSVYLAQLGLPIGLVLWLLLAPSRSLSGWLVEIAGSLLVFVALAYTGVWLFPPCWTPHVAAVLLLFVVFRSALCVVAGQWLVSGPGGDPLPIRFDERFLVRGDRLSLPGVTP